MPGLRKSHDTAVVWIPPQESWPPIQAIRLRHDQHVARWMPHVTLLYPFVPSDALDTACDRLEIACRAVAPFQVRLATFRHFASSRTVWIDPEPSDSILGLQSILQSAFPEYDDVARHPGGFTPHLSVGQGSENLVTELQETWQPIAFDCGEIALIRREAPPHDVFQVVHAFRLGTAQA